jgi:AcrR family transcriptional regulator
VTTDAVPAAADLCAAPRLGRPRDPSRDAALVESALQLLAEGGYAGLTMEAVAARAGVGKATLYRRWSGKEQLVVDALATLTEPLEPVAPSGVRDQLVVMLEAVRRKQDSRAGQIFPRLVGEAVDNPELMHRYRAQVLEPRRRRFMRVLQRGIDEGTVRPDVDLDHAVDLLIGPMAYRNLLRNDPAPGPDLPPRIVDDVLRALAPHPGDRADGKDGVAAQRPFSEKCW